MMPAPPIRHSIAGMRHDRLPDGFGVRIDPRVRAFSGGRILIGGSPARLLRLAPEAAAMIGDGYLEVTDQRSATVARRLLDSGVGNPRPRLLPSPEQVTVVVPLRDNAAGLDRLLAGISEHHRVIVVDDGSTEPVRDPLRRAAVTVLRHDRALGPSAARNAGLRAATTDYVAFLDSDVVPRTGWLEVMLGHFSDPEVALVAPRIVALDPRANALARYEHSRSSLDLGRREAAVRSNTVVSYVPSAALLVRRQALLDAGGFDEDMRVAEDVDLCWRLERAGWRLRYEPAARVAHDHRVTFRSWFARRRYYGTGAAPLAERHAELVSPLTLPAWTLLAAVLFGTGTKLGAAGGIGTLFAAGLRLRRALAGLDNPNRIAAIYVTRGFAGGLWRIASAACRHYWPVTLLAVLASRRIRRVALLLAVGEGLVDWYTHYQRDGLDPVRYLGFKRLDDIAYGSGLWLGAYRARSAAALTPVLRFRMG